MELVKLKHMIPCFGSVLPSNNLSVHVFASCIITFQLYMLSIYIFCLVIIEPDNISFCFC